MEFDTKMKEIIMEKIIMIIEKSKDHSVPMLKTVMAFMRLEIQ